MLAVVLSAILGSGPSPVKQELGAAPGPSGGAGPAPSVHTATSTLSTAAIERGMNADFKATVDEAVGKCGVELLDVACSSDCVLISRLLKAVWDEIVHHFFWSPRKKLA